MINKNCFLINHGLNKQYENAARKNLKALQQQNINTITNKRIQVGYIGNLLISFLDFIKFPFVKKSPAVSGG